MQWLSFFPRHLAQRLLGDATVFRVVEPGDIVNSRGGRGAAPAPGREAGGGVSQNAAQKFARVRIRRRSHLLRRAFGDDQAAAIPRLGTEVDDVIGALDDFEMVLDHEDGVPLLHQPIEHFHQKRHIVQMQARSGFVEDEERVGFALVRKAFDELEALGFASAENIQRLPESEIAEADLLQHGERLDDALLAQRSEEPDGFGDGKGKNIVDRFAPGGAPRGYAPDNGAPRTPDSARRHR